MNHTKHFVRPMVILLSFAYIYGPMLLFVSAEPRIAVDERVYDYGVVYLGEVDSVSHTFYLTNEGDQPLTITGTHPSCGCTRADLSGQVIEPGGVETLVAEFSFEKYTGKDQIRVTVSSDDPNTPSLDLGLQGYVLQPWQLDPTEVNAGVLVASTSSSLALAQIVHQSRLDDPDFNIVGVEFNPVRSKIKLLNQTDRTLHGRYREKTWQYEVRILAGPQFSEYESEIITFRTDSKERPTLSLSTRWKVEGDLEVEPRQLVLNRSKYFNDGAEKNSPFSNIGSDTARVRVRSRSGAPIKIVGLTATSPFVAEVVTGEESDRVWAEVTLDPVDSGDYSGILTIETNHPIEKRFDILLQGNAEPQKPIVSVPTDFHHFGKVFSDRVPEASKTFSIRNSGNRNLQLTLESKGGLEAYLADAQVLPGASTTLFIRKKLVEVLGPVLEHVVMLTNDSDRPRIEFRIQGEVLPSWRVDPPILQVSRTVPGKEEILKALVEQWFLSWEQPTRLLPGSPNDSDIRLEIGEMRTAYSGLGYGTAETEIVVHLQPHGKVGLNEAEIPLSGSPTATHPIPSLHLQWELLGQLRSLPRRIVFAKNRGVGQSDLEKEIKIYTLDKTPFNIREAISPPGVQVKRVDAETNNTLFNVQVSDLGLLAGQPNPVIVFRTDRPDEPEYPVEILLR